MKYQHVFMWSWLRVIIFIFVSVWSLYRISAGVRIFRISARILFCRIGGLGTGICAILGTGRVKGTGIRGWGAGTKGGIGRMRVFRGLAGRTHWWVGIGSLFIVIRDSWVASSAPKWAAAWPCTTYYNNYVYIPTIRLSIFNKWTSTLK